MTKPKLTPWYPPEIKPGRTGVYIREFWGFSYWDGTFWGFGHSEIDGAFRDRLFKSAVQNAKWRGLASKPSGK